MDKDYYFSSVKESIFAGFILSCMTSIPCLIFGFIFSYCSFFMMWTLYLYVLICTAYIICIMIKTPRVIFNAFPDKTEYKRACSISFLICTFIFYMINMSILYDGYNYRIGINRNTDYSACVKYNEGVVNGRSNK